MVFAPNSTPIRKQRDFIHLPNGTKVFPQQRHDYGREDVDDPPAIGVGRPAVETAREEVNEKQRNAKVQTFLGLFHNDGKEEGTDQCADNDGAVVHPPLSGPYVNVLRGEDPIDRYGGSVHHVIALDAKAEGQVVEGLEGNDLRKYQPWVESGGIGTWLRLPWVRPASGAEAYMY